MNVARLNMSHGDHASHRAVVDLVKEYNALGRGCLAIMLDTKGPEVRSGDLVAPIDMREGDRYTFTIDEGANGAGGRISVNYDGFIDDVSVGDTLLVDGGMQSLRIVAKTERDVECEVVDGGMVKSRRHLNIRGKSANLPAITDKDWLDLKFGIDMGVDYYALSFVRNADVIYELKDYLREQGAKIGVLAKIESADSVDHLEEILDAVDGAMVARGDLGERVFFLGGGAEKRERGGKRDKREREKQKNLFFSFKFKKLTLKKNSTNSRRRAPRRGGPLLAVPHRAGLPQARQARHRGHEHARVDDPEPDADARRGLGHLDRRSRGRGRGHAVRGDGVWELPAQGRVGDEDGGDEDGECDAGVCGDGKLGERGKAFWFFFRVDFF